MTKNGVFQAQIPLLEIPEDHYGSENPP